jgi:hypothetical protein
MEREVRVSGLRESGEVVLCVAERLLPDNGPGFEYYLPPYHCSSNRRTGVCVARPMITQHLIRMLDDLRPLCLHLSWAMHLLLDTRRPDDPFLCLFLIPRWFGEPLATPPRHPWTPNHYLINARIRQWTRSQAVWTIRLRLFFVHPQNFKRRL